MSNKLIIFGILSTGLTILIKEIYEFRKSYINLKRRKNKSWLYYD